MEAGFKLVLKTSFFVLQLEQNSQFLSLLSLARVLERQGAATPPRIFLPSWTIFAPPPPDTWI